MAILISQSRLRELLEEAYTEGTDDARVLLSHHDRMEWRTSTVDQLIEKAMQEDQRCVG